MLSPSHVCPDRCCVCSPDISFRRDFAWQRQPLYFHLLTPPWRPLLSLNLSPCLLGLTLFELIYFQVCLTDTGGGSVTIASDVLTAPSPHLALSSMKRALKLNLLHIAKASLCIPMMPLPHACTECICMPLLFP